MYKFSVNICENEKIKIKKRALELVIKKSNGDLRKLLNYLQSLYMHNHHLISEKKEKVNLEEDVYIIIDEKSVSKILVCPTEKAIEDLLKYIKNNKLNDSIKYLTNLIEIKDISLLELINFIYEYCMDNLINNIKVVDYSKEKIVNIIKDLAIINENLTYCNNENIQLISLLSIFYKI
jgi:DNA polymerase III gamma/tau subunit